MPIAINQDINTWLGSRRRICHMETVHVKDVVSYIIFITLVFK
jgi:hypothetical protein